MARANRHYISGYVWHITHRCHKKEFLLNFGRDKKLWLNWLFEAKKRYKLSVLNYIITSNHTHLLLYDSAPEVIPKSIQLVAGRTGQEYNLRKNRKGAFWEDRYHATAVKTDRHLYQCLVYIDLNMVRAGVIQHPSEWEYGGYNEIQQPKQRYSLIDRKRLLQLLGMADQEELSEKHSKWIDDALNNRPSKRDGKWTESIAVGDEKFVLETKIKLGEKAIGRKAVKSTDGYELRESIAPYNPVFTPEKSALSANNGYFWNNSD